MKKDNINKEKPFYKRWWFIVLIVLFIIGGVNNAFNNNDKSTNNENKSENVSKKSNGDSKQLNSDNKQETKKNESSKKKEKKLYNVGDTIRVGDLEYIVNSVEKTKTVGSEYFNTKAKGTFLKINITVQNFGKKAISLTNRDFNVYKGNVEYKSDSGAAIYDNNSNKLWLE